MIKPMLADNLKDVKNPSEVLLSDKWVAEIKLDGIRAVVTKKDSKVTITNRNLVDMTERLPELVEAFKEFPDGMYDGEITYVTKDGHIELTIANRRCANRKVEEIERLSKEFPVTYYIFDIMELEGTNLENETFEFRKEFLREMYCWNTTVVFLDYVTDKEELFEDQKSRGAEGIMLKNLDGKYLRSDGAKRSKDLLKWKIVQHDEPFIVGYAFGDKDKAYADIIGHFVLAKHNKDGQLEYMGGVGGGLALTERIWLKKLIDKLASKQTIHRDAIQGWRKGDEAKVDCWVAPIIRCKVEFNKLTKYGRYSFPEFRGILYEDHEDWDWTEITKVDAEELESYKEKMKRPAYKTSKKFFYRIPADKIKDILEVRDICVTGMKKAEMVSCIANIILNKFELQALGINEEEYYESIGDIDD